MGNKASSSAIEHEKELGDLKKAINEKSLAKMVGLLNIYGSKNQELAKEGCQQLFYSLERDGIQKKEAYLESLKTYGICTAIPAIIRAHHSTEAAGWACGIVVNLGKNAQENRKFENLMLEFVDHDLCEAIHETLPTTKNDFYKENGTAVMELIKKFRKGAERFEKLASGEKAE